MLMGNCGVGVSRAPRACRAAYQTPFIIRNQGSRCGFNYMQCSPDSLSLLANTICAVDRFPLIFHFSSKPALPRSPIHFAEQSIRTLFHCPFISPAALFPCVSSQWQINRLQTKETVRSKNQYRVFSLACNSDLIVQIFRYNILWNEPALRTPPLLNKRKALWTRGWESSKLSNAVLFFLNIVS